MKIEEDGKEKEMHEKDKHEQAKISLLFEHRIITSSHCFSFMGVCFVNATNFHLLMFVIRAIFGVRYLTRHR